MFSTVKKIFLLDILEAIPDEDWRRNWICFEKTIMLRMTSKNTQYIIDKMRLHVNVCLKFNLDDEMFKTMLSYLSNYKHNVSLKIINKGMIVSHLKVIEQVELVNLNLTN
jgi:hypothetical protein